MKENIGVAGPERPGDAAVPLRRIPLYAQAEKVLEDLLVRQRYRIGDRIPPEVELTQSLGVSRATIRAAVGRLVGRGLLVRRQGSGTFLARLPVRGDQPSTVGIKLGSEGGPVQWSRNFFLPGKLSLRLVRDIPADRDPAIVLQLFADA